MLKLKKHQIDILNQLDNLVENGENSFFIKSSMATGKTLCLSEFCKKYKDDRKCLVIGPKESIKAFSSDFEPEYDFYNYEKLYSEYKHNKIKFYDTFLKNYSIIVIDEAHKTGAKEYSKPITLIKEKGNYDYFIGASAHSRRMDQIHTKEDQCDILFDGNMVGDFDLSYCFDNNILVEPDYYYCQATLSQEIEDEIYKIQLSKIPLYIKNNLIENLQTIKLAYENYSSLEKTLIRGLNDYKDLENLKIIIFISRIDLYEEVKNLFEKSLNKIFLNREIHYFRYFSGDNKKNLDNYLNGDGINILFSVNRANLSLHHKDQKVCIMYRKTTSTIVYEQQIGRVLFTNQKGCIIDIVDNAHTVTPIQYSGDKSESSYIISNSRNRTFEDKVISEFNVNYCKYKDILALIKRKNYTNLSVEYKGETNTIKYFTNKYKKVDSDVFYFISKDIPFDRSLEAARTEYFVKFGEKEYSADLLAKRFNLNADELRYDIKNNIFKPNDEMIEFFDLNNEDLSDISNEINNFVNDLKNYYK